MEEQRTDPLSITKITSIDESVGTWRLCTTPATSTPTQRSCSSAVPSSFVSGKILIAAFKVDGVVSKAFVFTASSCSQRCSKEDGSRSAARVMTDPTSDPLRSLVRLQDCIISHPRSLLTSVRAVAGKPKPLPLHQTADLPIQVSRLRFAHRDLRVMWPLICLQSYRQCPPVVDVESCW
jgi:hypothetical protein